MAFGLASVHLYARCSVGWSASRVYGTLRSTGLLAGYIIPCYDVLHTLTTVEPATPCHS